MASNTNHHDWLNILTILTFVVIFVLIVTSFFFNNKGRAELDQIGRVLCHRSNLSYWYSEGETVHCYSLNETTGIKTGRDFWIDQELAKKIYLEPKPTLTSDLGDLYTTQDTINIEQGCKKGVGVFNISGNPVVCYHCLNENESIGAGIPAGGWLCPM
jgi:hypothetical protein